MDGFERLAEAAEVKEGEITEFEVGGVPLCLARANGIVHAFAASCTHQECPLSTAFIDGSELECECHGARFELATGAVTLPPATDDLTIYPAQEADGWVWVGIEVPAPS